MEIVGVPVWPTTAGLFGALCLVAFYSVLSSNWPENYFQSSDRLSFTVSRRFSRYMAFRFAPLLVVTCVVVGASIAHSKSGIFAATSILAFHLLFHVVRSLVNSLRRRGDYIPLAWSRVWVLAFITIAASATVGLGYWLVAVMNVPTPSLRETAVAGLAAGIATFFITTARLLTINDSASLTLLDASRRTLPPGLEDEVREVALENDVDPDLFVAIMHAENLQRPRWVRRLENLKVIVFRTGTTGLFQQSSRHRVSDIESARAAARRLSGTWPRGSEWERRGWGVREAAERQNEDRAFADQVADFYAEVSTEPLVATAGVARDGRALATLRMLSRFRTVATLRGEKANECGSLSALVTMPGGAVLTVAVEDRNTESVRTAWSVQVPFDFEDLELTPLLCRVEHAHTLAYPPKDQSADF